MAQQKSSFSQMSFRWDLRICLEHRMGLQSSCLSLIGLQYGVPNLDYGGKSLFRFIFHRKTFSVRS